MKTKEKIFEYAESLLDKLGLQIIKQDRERPWGGFLVLDESQAAQFAKEFFPEGDFESLKISEKVEPKDFIGISRKTIELAIPF